MDISWNKLYEFFSLNHHFSISQLNNNKIYCSFFHHSYNRQFRHCRRMFPEKHTNLLQFQHRINSNIIIICLEWHRKHLAKPIGTTTIINSSLMLVTKKGEKMSPYVRVLEEDGSVLRADFKLKSISSYNQKSIKNESSICTLKSSGKMKHRSLSVNVRFVVASALILLDDKLLQKWPRRISDLNYWY